jgi:hypothetical protein
MPGMPAAREVAWPPVIERPPAFMGVLVGLVVSRTGCEGPTPDRKPG